MEDPILTGKKYKEKSLYSYYYEYGWLELDEYIRKVVRDELSKQKKKKG